ncbi:MAG: porin [Spongiibacteraceae bacterium]
MSRNFKQRVVSAAIASAVFLPSVAHAGGTINFGPDQSVSVGFGVRTHFASIEDAAPDGDGRSKDFDLEDLRLYVSGSLNKYIKGTFNANKKSDNSMQIMDAIAQFEPSKEFNVWMGRMLPPSDRANLAGPFYAMAWDYPGVVSQYPQYAVGRDDGLMAWGKVANDMLLYSIGAFEGHNNYAGASSESDNLLYAGRLAINLMDAEPAPAYYEGTTYYGGFNIFTIGLTFQEQSDAVGTAATKGDYTAYNIDVLYETKDTGSGSLTLEGAYYSYDTDDVADVPYEFYGPNSGGITQGDAYLASVAYLFPMQVGMGKFQPYARYQKFETDLPADDTEITRYDIGVNYIIAGPNAKVSLTYFDTEVDKSANDSDTNGIILGVQLQF